MDGPTRDRMWDGKIVVILLWTAVVCLFADKVGLLMDIKKRLSWDGWMYLRDAAGSPFLSRIGLACLCKLSDLPRPVWNLLLCALIGWNASRDLSVLIRQLRQVGIQYACVTDILHASSLSLTK